MADPSSMTVLQLQALCKTKGIKGYSGKKKAELLALLQPVVEVPKVEEPKVKEKIKKGKSQKRGSSN